MPTELTAEKIAELVRESGFVNHLSDSFKDWCDPPDYCRRCLRAALAHVLAREAVTERMLDAAIDTMIERDGRASLLAVPHWLSQLPVCNPERVAEMKRRARKRIEEEQP